MKKMICFLLLAMTSSFAWSQTYDSVAPYKKDKNMPEFQVLLTDSSWYTNKTDNKGLPTLIIYFSPDCNHCQNLAGAMSKKMNDFKDVNILWVTYLPPLEELNDFKRSYLFDRYKNVYFGKDPNYIIPAFFRVEYTPFIALYDKDKKLSQTWGMEGSVEELKLGLQKLAIVK